MNAYSAITHSWITRVIYGIITCAIGIILDVTFLYSEWQPMTLMMLIIGMISIEEIRGGSYRTSGFPFDALMLKETFIGLLMGILPIISLIGLYALFSWIDIQVKPQFELLSIVPILSFAMIEELIFRGIIFQALVERFGMINISLIFAILFSLAHLANPNYEPIAMVNTFLASLVFSYAWYHTKGLWLPIVLHSTWNLVLVLSDMTLSGMTLKNGLFISTLSSDIPMPWLHSEYGIEGTVFCMLSLLLFFSIIRILPQSPYRIAEYYRVTYFIPSANHEEDYE